MTRRPRCLLDTEAVLRAWRNDGPARELLQRGMIRDVSLCTSTTILDEVDEVLARPKFAATPRQRQALRRVLLVAADDIAVFDEAEAPRRSPDPGDDHVIEAALRTRADVVVSRNTTDLLDPAYTVRDAGDACRWLREHGPYGTTVLLSVEDQRRQESGLAEEGDGRHRLGADAHFREVTEPLNYQRATADLRVAPLTTADTVELVEQLVSACGTGLVFDARHGVNFDYLSGLWTDTPGRGGLTPLDLIWFTSDRAQSEALAIPDEPTVADWGWPDESRFRSLLAGGMVIIVERRGPGGEPDIRGLVLVAEPLLPVPESQNPHRRVHCTRHTIDVVSADPAGFATALYVWLPGGPAGLVSAVPLDPRGVDCFFVRADEIAGTLGWPH